MKRDIIFGLILGVITSGGCSSVRDAGSAGDAVSAKDGIFSYRVGRFEVYLLVESERPGNTGILSGADESILQKFIPETGFYHSANAVLIRVPVPFRGRRNILIDTGTGRQGEPIFEKIKKLGVEPDQIDAVLITHLHGDHFGGLVREGKAAFPRAKVYLSAREYNFFTKEQPNEAAIAALALYGSVGNAGSGGDADSRVITFEPGGLGSASKALLPGITPIAAYGHTPGHTVFMVENRREKLLVLGDLLHVALVQFPVPEISATFDMDPVTSAVMRRQVMAYAAENKIPVAGMHIVYPGIGYVEAKGEGFRFIPVK